MSDTEPQPASPHLRLPRRRRSVASTPALLEPVDLPEDAPGRVEVVAVRAPADVLEPAEAVISPPPQVERHLVQALLAYDGWAAIGVLAVVLVVIFLIGLRFTH